MENYRTAFEAAAHKATASFYFQGSYERVGILDINNLRALKEAMEEFGGVSIIVSHDRWFLDRICTHLIVYEGDSIARMYIGSGSGYEMIVHEKSGKDLTPYRVNNGLLKRRCPQG